MDLLNKIFGRSERNQRTLEDLKVYLTQRYDLLKLELMEKSSQILSMILSIIIVLVCALAVLIYLSSALISWLTIALNAGWAYTIVCGIFILIIVFILMTKDKLFINPLIRKFSRILYSKEYEAMEAEIVEEKGGEHE
ncbi:MAG: phage holin family protein [Bacteroidales bacterium]|nr:phage holin family protein [Bacteroidales bacterium]